MMTIEQRIDSLIKLGEILKDDYSPETNAIIQSASIENPWFTKENIISSLDAIAYNFLKKEAIQVLVQYYHLDDKINSKSIGLVLAGNIPLVGFHDILCCYLVGHKAVIKLSDKDKLLIPHLTDLLGKINVKSKRYFEYVDKLRHYDAVIATGSDNTAKLFEYYFRKCPHIIRYNRNAVAILSGIESAEELRLLADDVFSYFGLGCRNVSKLYLPDGYEINCLFEAFLPYQEIINHNKYKNNYDYNVALYLLNKEPFLHNEFVILREAKEIPSRIGTLHYEYYNDLEVLDTHLLDNQDKIQCVVSNTNLKSIACVPIGQAQNPHIDTYADGVDTIMFLMSFP